MKQTRILLTLALFVSVPHPLFAQSVLERELKQLNDERDRSMAAAAEPINRRYKASLEQLLRRSMQNNNLETALKIKETLQSLGGVAEASAIADPTGKWEWSSGRVVTIGSDGKFSVDTGGGGTWRWKKPGKGEFTMIWDKGDYVDSLVINADGTAITGSNNKGDQVNVSRLK